MNHIEDDITMADEESVYEQVYNKENIDREMVNSENIDEENRNRGTEEIPEKEIQIKKWFLVFLIPLILLLLLCGIEQMMKSQGIHYRSWLEISISIGFLFLLPFLFFTFLELTLEFCKKRKGKKSVSIIAGLLQILLIGLMGFYIPVMGFFYLLTFESTYEVEKEIGDGYIEGTTQGFLESDTDQKYAYYTKVSFFGKKK